MLDLNGWVGMKSTGFDRVILKTGEETKNNNGQKVLQLRNENDSYESQSTSLSISTRMEPNKNENSLIDYFLIFFSGVFS